MSAADTSAIPEGHRVVGLLAEYADTDSLLAAATKVRDAGYTRWDAHLPFPVHGIDEAMGIRRTILPYIVFVCGFCGAIGGLALEWYTNTFDYPWIVSGKPYFSLPANIPPMFETTILLAAFGAFFGMLALNGLPMLYHAVFNSNRLIAKATTDRFFISIEAVDPSFVLGKSRALLDGTAAVGVEVVTEEIAQERIPLAMRRLVFPTLLILIPLLCIPPFLILRERARKHESTRLQVIWDMDSQPKYRTQAENTLFADGRAMRPPVMGTVAHTEIVDNPAYTTGIVDATWVTGFPVEVDDALLALGRERFDIYCAQCHGLDGYGNGPIAARADRLQEGTWVPPTSMHDQLVRGRANGHLFNTITNGIRTMPPYGDQIPAYERWAIVAYVRALQYSQRAPLDDVPPDVRGTLR